MQPEFVSGSLPLEVAWAAGIFIVSVFIAWLVLFGMRYAQRKLEKRTRKPALLPQLLKSLARPLSLLIALEGLILALSSVSNLATWHDNLAKASIAVVIAMVTYALASGGTELLAWYLRRVRTRQVLIRLIRRFVLIIIYIIGLLIILDYFNISISPLIAGLGIGGLAIALALQPTLSNFFAGTQIVSDSVVRVGDYIEMEDGSIRGYVTDVGWRSTRIRTPHNNLVIIPNSRLAESVITNYFGPTMEMAVLVNCGVSYNADLLKVESIALEVAREVIQELDEANKGFDPWFAYEEFGDSNINFWVWLQAKDRIASFRVKSEVIKRLKASLDKEGITINYPARLLTFDPDTLPPALQSRRPDSGGSEEEQ